MTNNVNWELALQKANSSPRCNAKTRKNTKCQAPSMNNGRCRLHGGKSTGAPRNEAHGNYKHGKYSIEYLSHKKYIRELVKQLKETLNNFE